MLDPDAVARSMQRLGVRSTSSIDAGRSVLEMAEGYLNSRSSFLIETTLSGNTYLRMMARAKELGYLVVLLYVGTSDVSINIQRVKIRVLKGGHDVPVEDQLRRYPRSFANLRKALELADEAIVFDNSTLKGHTKVAVKDANGFKIFEPVPEWAAFLRN